MMRPAKEEKRIVPFFFVFLGGVMVIIIVITIYLHQHFDQRLAHHASLLSNDAAKSLLVTQVDKLVLAKSQICQHHQENCSRFFNETPANYNLLLSMMLTMAVDNNSNNNGLSSTLLVIVFNDDRKYYVAPLNYAIYGRIFADVYFCGPSFHETTFHAALRDQYGAEIAEQFTPLFLAYQRPHRSSIKDSVGETVYFCFNLALIQATTRHHHRQFSGVFVVHDDAVINYWLTVDASSANNSGDFLSRSHSLPIGLGPRHNNNRAYEVDTLSNCDAVTDPDNPVTECKSPNYWPNWPRFYLNASIDFYEELIQLGSSSDSPPNSTYAECLANITKRAGGIRRVFPGMSDAFYIARRDFRAAFAMFELAERHRLFQEIAVPTTFACFDAATTGILDPSGDNTDGVNRQEAWQAFDARRLVMHPFKLSQLSSLISAAIQRRDMNGSRLTEEEINRLVPSKGNICLFCLLADYAKHFTNNKQ